MTRVFVLFLVLTGCVADVSISGGEDTSVKPAGDPRSIPWSVSLHVSPSDARAAVSRDLALIEELGATYVRTDLWWYSIEPSRGYYDQAALDFFRWFVEEAAAHHLGVVTILSGPPEWALSLYKSDRNAFATAFGNYSERVAARVGDLVDFYQLWNEPNHITDVSDADTDIALFRAGRAGIERGAPGRPFRTAINVLVDWHEGPINHWEDDIRYYFDHGAAGVVDIITIDHYPGTWSIGDWGGNIVDRLFALGRERNTAVAIFEAGYSTPCSLPLNTEAAQADWIRTQLPRMHERIRAGTGAQLALVNWYELDDRNTGNCFDPEDNFGVVHTDRTRKPGFAALRAEIAKF